MGTKFPFFEKDKETGEVIFRGYKLEVYLPDKVSNDARMFEPIGDEYNLFGVLNFRVYANETDKKGKMYTLTIPVTVVTAPSNIESGYANLLDEEDEKHTILQYEDGDMFIKTLDVTQVANDAYKFISMFHAGRIPRAIEYSKLLDLYMSGITTQGVSLGVPSSVVESVIAGINRNAKDINQPFRKAIGKNPNINQHAYQPINMNRLPMINSTFTALSFERINDSIVSSTLKAKNNAKELESPLEKTIKY